MGAICSCGAALVADANAAGSKKQKPLSDDERTPTGIPSTGGLQILLQQSFLRESFRSFVKQTWSPLLSNDSTPYFRSHARTLALNCIDFLTDVRDLHLMHNNSLFQSYRACHIFEKYLMHGATQQVPHTSSPLSTFTKPP